MTCGGENGTNGSHFPVLSEDIAFASHFVARDRSAVLLATPVKNYLKWWEIQLAIQCTVDTMNYFE